MKMKRWLGVLAAMGLFLWLIIMPALRAVRERARRAVCPNNLKQIGLAMHNYHDRHGCFPAAATFDDRGRPLLSWRVTILPFMEEDALYREFHLNEPWYSPHNRTLLGKMPAAFACPLNEGRKGWAEMSTYQVIIGPQTMFTGGTAGVRLADVTDGTANTILVVETNDLAPWTAPHDVAFSSASSLGTCGSGHPGGLNAAMADGSVHFLKSTIDPGVLWSLITRDGGEVIKPEQY
jgi:prepilin-type processing-associated H-X9-DG protein